MSTVVKRKLPEWIMACKKRKGKVLATVFQQHYVERLVNCMETCIELLSMSRSQRIDSLFEDSMSQFHFVANCGLWNVVDMDEVLQCMEYIFPGKNVLGEINKVAHDEEKMMDLLIQTIHEIEQAHSWQLYLLKM